MAVDDIRALVDEQPEYDFPDDLEAAESLLNEIVFEVQSIQEQLGNRNRTHPDGSRYTEVEYWEWRHRAAGANRHRMNELRALKAHVKALRIVAFEQRAAERKQRAAESPVHIVDKLVIAYREQRVDDVGRHLAELSERWNVQVAHRPLLEEPR